MGGGTLVCDVSLDRGGYVPGETILINAVVNNNSGITIKSIRAALTEVSTKNHTFWIYSLS